SPVSCAAACAVCDTVDDDLLASVAAKADVLRRGLAELPGVVGTRGLGLLLAAELDRPAADVVGAALARGLVVGSAGERVLRLTPPLTISPAEVEQGLALLGEALAA